MPWQAGFTCQAGITCLGCEWHVRYLQPRCHFDSWQEVIGSGLIHQQVVAQQLWEGHAIHAADKGIHCCVAGHKKNAVHRVDGSVIDPNGIEHLLELIIVLGKVCSCW